MRRAAFTRAGLSFYVSMFVLSHALLCCWPQSVGAGQARGGRLIPEKRSGAATASYFAKAGHVTVQVEPLRLAGDERSGVVLIPSFIVPGKKVVPPRLVNLQFIVDSPAAAPAPPPRVLRILSGGRELASGAPTLISAGRPVGGFVTRVLMYKLTYGKFLELLKGEEVRIILGRDEFDLTDEQLTSMRDLPRMVAEGVSFR